MNQIQENVQRKRSLTSWIQSYVDYTANVPSPEIFRRWAAVAAVAGALERRVWVHTASSKLYPNMFLLLVAPPGVGKDKAIMPMRDLWADTGLFNIAPISMTHKGLIDQLAAPTSQKSFIDKTVQPPAWTNYHSLLCAVPELGVLLPSHDLGFLSALNELFNCWDLFEERLRTTGEVLRIERPHIHLIAGTQPKYLGELLPEAAYGMGFTARIIMIYAGEPKKVSLFEQTHLDKSLHDKLVSDLKSIGGLAGPMNIEKEAAAALDHWHLFESDQDKPMHSKLLHYNARRILHVLKLSMVFSASRSNDMIISLEDFENAKALLLEAEELMPEIFKEISSGGQMAEMEEAFHFVFRIYTKTKAPVSEALLTKFLAARMPVTHIDFIINAMLRSNMLQEVEKNPGLNLPDKMKTGHRLFKPLELTKLE